MVHIDLGRLGMVSFYSTKNSSVHKSVAGPSGCTSKGPKAVPCLFLLLGQSLTVHTALWLTFTLASASQVTALNLGHHLYPAWWPSSLLTDPAVKVPLFCHGRPQSRSPALHLPLNHTESEGNWQGNIQDFPYAWAQWTTKCMWPCHIWCADT